MGRTVIKFKLDIEGLFPTDIKDAINNTYYTKESINKAMEDILNIPFISKVDGIEKAVGYIINYKEGLLWVELLPEIQVDEVKEVMKKNEVQSFSINAIMIK